MSLISDNLLSAFLEGNTSAEDTIKVLNAAASDPELRNVIKMSYEIDNLQKLEERILPYQALAAKEHDNRCAILCELYILSQNGINRTSGDWEKQAFQQGWLKEGGTPLYNIGRLLEQECFSIARSFHNTVDTLKEALATGHVIVVVDSKELTTDVEALDREKLEDDFVGANPNHAVVVTGVEDKRIRYYDPATDSDCEISQSLFMDAWQDSSRYMVKVSKRDLNNYEPHPIDLSDVELPEELNDLREAIAENAHEVWAMGRKAQGWTYGPERNDTLKQTPDMVPYSDLTDSEKMFDREMAMNTIKLLKKLGYRIEKE